MIQRYFLVAVTTLATAASVPASARAAAAARRAETIEFSVAPCMGFCPVYDVKVGPAGHLVFHGVKQTAALGERLKRVNPSVYRAFARALAPYRPRFATSQEPHCETRVSDLQTYRIAWTRADGQTTTLEHDRGCRSPDNDALNKVIDRIPQMLGIARWTRQVTRPGSSRG